MFFISMGNSARNRHLISYIIIISLTFMCTSLSTVSSEDCWLGGDCDR